MSINFEELSNLPIHKNLLEEFKEISNFYKFNLSRNQICINDIDKNSDNVYRGIGSLIKDWNNAEYDKDKLKIPKKEIKLEEKQFNYICNQFKNTTFEDIYIKLKEKYNIGRFRFMIMKPKSCLSWHYDDTERIHYPLKTQNGCFMIIDKELIHLEQNKWYLTKTKKHHTALNSSLGDRIHLVASRVI